MAAGISVRVYTGADANTESSAVSGIDLMSADGATNSLANRVANPIVAGQKSYEKWLKLYIDSAPDNQVDNQKIYSDSSVEASTHLYWGTTATGVTPTSADSAVATNDATSYTSGAQFTWDTNSLTGVGSKSGFYLVIQLDIDADAAAGNWTQETLTYSYDEC